jgi:hypothetical protein
MSETETHDTPAPAAEPIAPVAPEAHKDEDRLEHAKNSLIHAVEGAVGKFTDTLSSIGGRK